MTDQQHPITPPPELVQQWMRSIGITPANTRYVEHIATQAANWGSDQELEACCEYIAGPGRWFVTPQSRLAELRAARRPKPPSLKEQALHALLHIDQGQHNERYHIIRRALNQLPNE